MTETEQLVIDLYKAREAKKAAKRWREDCVREFGANDLDTLSAYKAYLAASRAAATALRRVLAQGKRLYHDEGGAA